MTNATANDTALIATCNAAAEADNAFHAVCADTDCMTKAGQAAQQSAADHRSVLLDRMMAMQAATMEGMQAKARIVARVHQFHDHPNEGPLLSLLADLGATRQTD